jgi:Ca-activated chloride channel family protein
MIFHFLRPWWFLAIIPAILLLIFSLNKGSSSNNNWAKYCDAHLLQHLISNETRTLKNYLPYILLILWLIAISALAGPTWSMYGQPVYQKNIARVIALDVSQSMTATDIAPSRLDRAKYKSIDLLHNITEGQTGMVVFSSSSFLVSPLTNDTNTIASMVPVLDNNIVPVQGSDILPALKKSAKLLKQAGNTRGEIILITDSTPSDEAIKEAKTLATDGFTTSVLGIGTENSSDGLRSLATAGSGSYVDFSNDNSDIDSLLLKRDDITSKASKELQIKSLWKDEGHYLIWLLVFLVAFLARRGWLEKIC